MSQIKLKHSGGNGVIIAAPSSNPAADRTITLPSDADGTLARTIDVDYVKLQSANSTVDVSDLTFDSLDVTSYKSFRIIGSVLPATDEVVLYCRLRASGSSLTSSDYQWKMYGTNASGNAFTLSSSGEDKALIANNAGNSTREGMRFDILITPRVSGDGFHNNFGFTQGAFLNTSTGLIGFNAEFVFNDDSVSDGFTLFHNSGNVSEYSYCLYGIRR